MSKKRSTLTAREKREVVQAFDAAAAGAVDARNRMLTQKKGRARSVRVVAPDGTVKGLATHADVLQGLLKRAEVDAAVQGRRPTEIICADCPAVVKVPRGGVVPKRCKRCSERERSRVRRARDPERLRGASRRSREKHRDKIRERARESREKINARQRARRDKLRPRPTEIICADCPAVVKVATTGALPKRCGSCVEKRCREKHRDAKRRARRAR